MDIIKRVEFNDIERQKLSNAFKIIYEIAKSFNMSFDDVCGTIVDASCNSVEYIVPEDIEFY